MSKKKAIIVSLDLGKHLHRCETIEFIRDAIAKPHGIFHSKIPSARLFALYLIQYKEIWIITNQYSSHVHDIFGWSVQQGNFDNGH